MTAGCAGYSQGVLELGNVVAIELGSGVDELCRHGWNVEKGSAWAGQCLCWTADGVFKVKLGQIRQIALWEASRFCRLAALISLPATPLFLYFCQHVQIN
jgi:hypothetical protein